MPALDGSANDKRAPILRRTLLLLRGLLLPELDRIGRVQLLVVRLPDLDQRARTRLRHEFTDGRLPHLQCVLGGLLAVFVQHSDLARLARADARRRCTLQLVAHQRPALYLILTMHSTWICKIIVYLNYTYYIIILKDAYGC